MRQKKFRAEFYPPLCALLVHEHLVERRYDSIGALNRLGESPDFIGVIKVDAPNNAKANAQ